MQCFNYNFDCQLIENSYLHHWIKISAQARVSTELINLVQLQRQFQNLAQHEGFGSGSGQRLQQGN